ncbi:hypothetical protein QBC43DRAFT_13158 [Cladorrhinum sp. PSN259]|nr:hypothetical protein QBC43DRAFT_13158 [Cladorrhinum sp. PSN259]
MFIHQSLHRTVLSQTLFLTGMHAILCNTPTRIPRQGPFAKGTETFMMGFSHVIGAQDATRGHADFPKRARFAFEIV